MKKFFLIALVALTTAVFCKKEKNDTDPSNPSNPGSSKVLKRIIETENGQTITHNLIYDANKRITSVRSTNNSEVVSFTYDGNGNVTKIENKEGNERTVFEYTYNNNLPVSGSFKNFEKDEAENEVLAIQ